MPAAPTRRNSASTLRIDTAQLGFCRLPKPFPHSLRRRIKDALDSRPITGSSDRQNLSNSPKGAFHVFCCRA